jgi:enoyl-CoA hydratase/carnithine racemase
MSSDSPILYDVKGHVATITLNRPEKMNAFTNEMLDLWHESVNKAHLDDGVRVVVVTGAGRGFCSGADVSTETVGGDVMGDDPSAPAANRNGLRNSVQRVPRALLSLEKPYIAALNGAAVGAGMDMASMADIRIAAENAKFGMAYVRMGLIPGDGGAYYLPRIVGMAKALELMWTGRIFTAQEALEMGYVSRVVEREALAGEVESLAAEIANSPAVSVQLIKRLAYRSAAVGVHEALEMAEHAMVIARTTEDAKEGPKAFAEKRPPKFQGR